MVHQYGPLVKRSKTAASHAANMGSIPVRVTNSFFFEKRLTVRQKFDTILAVEKGSKERKNLKFSLLTFFFGRKYSWC